MPYHRTLAGENVHALYRWQFADEATRIAASDLTAEDVGKLAWQQDDDTFWFLTNHSPITWAPMGAGADPFLTKSVGFTAEPYTRYAVDVSSAALTVDLPASPNAGEWFEFYDATSNADTNNITLDGNGNNIMGASEDLTISTAGLYFKIIYFDSTGGYRVMRLV